MVRAPTLTAEPDLVTILQTYNDVTERLKRSHETLLDEVARLREELHEKNRELQRRERLAALGEMAAGVAHEIRNPLGGIGLYSSLLERDLVDRPAEREIARRISAGVQNLENIVRGVLSFAGDAEPRFADISLATVLESALLQTTPQASALEAYIDVDPRLAGVELWCDAGQVERALLNLLFNALDAAGSKGRVWVRLGDRDEPDGLVPVVVEDDGPGIALDCLQRVFNPFFTTKDHGTGLGLAIVHRIAEAHGGCVRAGNRVGGGARFVLSLPGSVNPDAADDREVLVGMQQPTGGEE
ncbi:MAG: ATP-binding protein [Planctomycetota bacterium]